MNGKSSITTFFWIPVGIFCWVLGFLLLIFFSGVIIGFGIKPGSHLFQIILFAIGPLIAGGLSFVIVKRRTFQILSKKVRVFFLGALPGTIVGLFIFYVPYDGSNLVFAVLSPLMIIIPAIIGAFIG